MTELLRPIEIAHPATISFGAGLVGSVGAWAKARGVSRTLVVAGGSNAGRVGLLGLIPPDIARVV